MVTTQELAKVVLVPLLVASAIGLLGWWRRWAWAMPLAAAGGFLAGYGSIGVPRLPPLDGTDWLFWLAIPLAALGVVDAVLGRAWGWALGLAAGAVVYVVVRPLTPHAVPASALNGAAAALAVVSAAVVAAVGLAERRTGSLGSIGALTVAAAGTAVVVMSNAIRIVGVYGIAAAAALAAVAVLAARVNAGRSVAVFAVPLMAGMLAAARFYPDKPPGWTPLLLTLASPALAAAAGMLVPGRRTWPRAAAAVAAVAILVGTIAGPMALKAKRDAERPVDPDDPASYYQ